MSIKVGILEDDAYVLQEISEIVKASKKLEYVMAASSGEKLLKYFNDKTDMDILLTDVGLPGISGIEVITKIKNICPTIEIIVLSSYHDNDTIFKALRAGATGYLLKDASFDEIERKLIEANEGSPALSPAIANRMISFFNATKTLNVDYNLAPKEKQVLQLLIEGLSYKLIAVELDISIDGVRYHVKKIYKKVHINSRPELMRMYMDGKLKL